MQPLKFRAWVKDSKLMLPDQNPTASNTVVYMQFTGYTDKNGKEVYEHDILRFIDMDSEEYDQFWLVEREFGGFWLDGSGIWDYSDDKAPHEWSYQLKGLEVVGNLYEDKNILPAWKIKDLEQKGVL